MGVLGFIKKIPVIGTVATLVTGGVPHEVKTDDRTWAAINNVAYNSDRMIEAFKSGTSVELRARGDLQRTMDSYSYNWNQTLRLMSQFAEDGFLHRNDRRALRQLFSDFDTSVTHTLRAACSITNQIGDRLEGLSGRIERDLQEVRQGIEGSVLKALSAAERGALNVVDNAAARITDAVQDSVKFVVGGVLVIGLLFRVNKWHDGKSAPIKVKRGRKMGSDPTHQQEKKVLLRDGAVLAAAGATAAYFIASLFKRAKLRPLAEVPFDRLQLQQPFQVDEEGAFDNPVQEDRLLHIWHPYTNKFVACNDGRYRLDEQPSAATVWVLSHSAEHAQLRSQQTSQYIERQAPLLTDWYQHPGFGLTGDQNRESTHLQLQHVGEDPGIWYILSAQDFHVPHTGYADTVVHFSMDRDATAYAIRKWQGTAPGGHGQAGLAGTHEKFRLLEIRDSRLLQGGPGGHE